MHIIKPLSHYIRRYLTIQEDALARRVDLLNAKERLDRLFTEYNTDQEPQRGGPDRLALADLTEPNQVTLWTSGDGSRVQVSEMSEAHLHYALAKGARGDYPDSASRRTGVRALKIEAFRRLRNELTSAPPKTIVSADKAPCAWCRGKLTHLSHCPTLSNP
jgi:hypothetical protein